MAEISGITVQPPVSKRLTSRRVAPLVTVQPRQFFSPHFHECDPGDNNHRETYAWESGSMRVFTRAPTVEAQWVEHMLDEAHPEVVVQPGHHHAGLAGEGGVQFRPDTRADHLNGRRVSRLSEAEWPAALLELVCRD